MRNNNGERIRMNENSERIKEKLDFFYNQKIKVHIIKHNKEFLNGILLRIEGEGIYILNEDQDGETRIFSVDIFEVKEFKERVEVVGE